MAASRASGVSWRGAEMLMILLMTSATASATAVTGTFRRTARWQQERVQVSSYARVRNQSIASPNAGRCDTKDHHAYAFCHWIPCCCGDRRTFRIGVARAAACHPAAGGTVSSGVYTDAQAKRGQTVYAEACSKCHLDDLSGGKDSPPLVGDEFLKGWTGKTVGALFDEVRMTMPFDSPGRLTAGAIRRHPRLHFQREQIPGREPGTRRTRSHRCRRFRSTRSSDARPRLRAPDARGEEAVDGSALLRRYPRSRGRDARR